MSNLTHMLDEQIALRSRLSQATPMARDTGCLTAVPPAPKPLPKLIAITGQAGSGKSTVSNWLALRGYRQTKFAGPLKSMMRTLLALQGVSAEEINECIEGSLKEAPRPYLNGNTPRHAMQTLGTNWARVHMGSDFWVNAWREQVRAASGSVVVDDCRFENEAAAVRELGGVVVRLVGRGGIASDHVSEAGVRPDVVLDNSGPVSQLFACLEHALNGWGAVSDGLKQVAA